MKRYLLPILFAAITAGAEEPSMNQVRETLRVETAGGKVLVHVTVNNGTDKPIWAPAALVRAKALTRREFDVRAKGAPVDYTGRMVKRGPITADDFVKVNPHAKVENTIDITDSYAWASAPRTYTLGIEGSYLPDVALLDRPTPVTTVPVEFFR
jgi:hypothetical protein